MIRAAPLTLTLTLTLAFAAPLAAAPVGHAAPVARDWTQVAAVTSAGGYLLGNPRAEVKLVEYLSLTCPHCSAFEAEAAAPLVQYVRTGRVSYEVRLALRDAYDMAAALLARCEGPQRFFAALPPLYAAQGQWMAQAGVWSQTAPDLAKLPPGEAMKAVAAGAGLDRFFLARGLPPARAQACLTDKGAEDILARNAQAIWNRPGFSGTPAFEIDGQMIPDIHDWAALKAQLDVALR